MEEIVGKRFDMLVVKKYVRRTQYKDNVWECKCDCGRVVERNEKTLFSKRFHSCGCASQKNLRPGDSKLCSKAGKERARKRNVDGINWDSLDDSKNYATNSSGHKGVSWSNTARKWHVFVGYKGYRCNLAYVEDYQDAVNIREAATKSIKDGTFEEFFYKMRGFHIGDRLNKIEKRKM